MPSFLEKFSRKPRITILADRPGWAYDICAQQLSKILRNDFDITVKYVCQNPTLDSHDFDLIHVCFWGEKYHTQFNIPKNKILKEISSHRWQYDKNFGPCAPQEFPKTFLDDASFFCATSLCLHNLLSPFIPNLFHVINGIERSQFFPIDIIPQGKMRIGWAGNSKDPVKCVDTIIRPAAADFDIEFAEGTLPHTKIAAFYQAKDIYTVASEHEGTPLPLIEAMACGCFPVCCNVGIVPEIIEHKINGYIVTEHTVEAFRNAFEWCANNIEYIRSQRKNISQKIHSIRNWEACSQTYKEFWLYALKEIYFPIFRNDDLTADTNLSLFKQFCSVFHENHFTQIHAVTLRGHCNVLYQYGGIPSEYPDEPPISLMTNRQIEILSKDIQLKNQLELINYINSIPDEVAFHGTCHFDFSQMTEKEQIEEFKTGMLELKNIFPQKDIKYFIPPFNRTNEYTEKIASAFGLQTLLFEGRHLEEEIDSIEDLYHTIYRYHHHRFYPESTFSYYTLNLQKIGKFLHKNVTMDPIDFSATHQSFSFFSIIKKSKNFVKKISKKILHRDDIEKIRLTDPLSIPLPQKKLYTYIKESGTPLWHFYAYTNLHKRSFTREALHWIISNVKKDSKILEIGCGAGQNLLLLEKFGFTDLYGIEVDTAALTAAQKISKELNYRYTKFVCKNLLTIHTNEMYDLIFTLDCIYLIDNFSLEEYIKRWISSLIGGGIMVFDVIDAVFELHPKRKYLTSDWNKEPDERSSSEYKFTCSKKQILYICKKYNLELIHHQFFMDIPQRSIYILKKVV